MELGILNRLASEINFKNGNMWVYGSYAYGIENSNSDIDILIYQEEIEKPYKKSIEFETIPVSLNYFGRKCITDPEILRDNGLYFITRFLSPTKLISGVPSFGEQIEKICFSKMIAFMCNFLNQIIDLKESNPNTILSLLYLFKSKMNRGFILYFSKWFGKSEFDNFWNSKSKVVREVLEGNLLNLSEILIVKDLPLYRLIKLQQLSANFWKFSYSYRGYDEEHINMYHENLVKLLDNLKIDSLEASINFLISHSSPYKLVE